MRKLSEVICTIHLELSVCTHFGFGRQSAISSCRSLSQLPVDTVFEFAELAVVDNLRFTLEISMISVTVIDI